MDSEQQIEILNAAIATSHSIIVNIVSVVLCKLILPIIRPLNQSILVSLPVLLYCIATILLSNSLTVPLSYCLTVY